MADNTIRIRGILDDKISAALAKIRDQVNTIGGKGTAASLFGNIGAQASAKALSLVKDAAGAAADFIGDSIDAARDLGETLSKSRVVFGQSARSIEAFGDAAADKLGLSKQAAIEAAATFGNFFTGLGQSQSAASAMSQRLVTLAGDLASFNNLDPTEALDKLRSGLAGEAEPLRRLGVFLSESKVKTKAMEMGLVEAHEELTEGEKVLARYQIILDETATAQGDFARTSESLANKQRTATAKLINAQAELGEKFEPIALQVTEWQIDFIAGMGAVTREWDKSWKSNEQRAAEAMAGIRSEAEKTTTAMEDNRVGMAKAARQYAEALPDAMEEEGEKAVRIVRDTTGDMAKAITSGRQEYRDSWDLYLQALEDVGDKGKQIARLQGHLTSDELRKGLKSKEPALRRAAADQRDIIVARLQTLSGKAFDWGSKTIVQFIKGMNSKLLALDAAAERAAGKVSDNLRVRSPAKKGPLSRGGGPEGWGRSFAAQYARGLRFGSGPERSAAVVAGNVVRAPAGTGAPVRASTRPIVLQVNLDGRVLARSVDRHLWSDLQRAAPTVGKV